MNRDKTEIQNMEESPNVIIEIPNANIAINNLLPAFLVIGIYAAINIVIKDPTAGVARKTPNTSEGSIPTGISIISVA